MYYFSGIILLILLFFFCLNYRRRKKIIEKICCMSAKQKCHLLNELSEPFGFRYTAAQDIFTSRIDAMQRNFGYCSLYDKSAPALHMVIDCLPVYFNYNRRTWLIELWKGQYGINTGGEIGIYYADRIIPEQEWSNTLFQCVEDKDMAGLSFSLSRNGMDIADVCERHWWLTAFSVGCFSDPADLCMYAGFTFPDNAMAGAFAKALERNGCCRDDICLCNNSVTFSFTKAFIDDNFLRRLRIRPVQVINSFWCKVYLFITRPFCLSCDRILYLYYYLPFVFRRILRIRKYKMKGRKK